jgi:TDG/mug DNA glycosylase family protein
VKVHSFRPIADAASRVLVLGSMPGKVSLAANQYYAHPRNVFWKLMEELLGVEAEAPYRQRVAALRAEGVALWDVLKTCTRTTSLDSDIVPSSAVPNDFHRFLVRHPAIALVCFNGARAEHEYRKQVLPALPDSIDVAYRRLPSTSPANAAIPYRTKRSAWRAVARALAQ